MTTYAEYCPIAVGAEVFGDRWTPLVLRELMIGERRFNDIHRGLPKMNRTLLVQRLRSLERRGIIERHTDAGGKNVEYCLTEAGHELEPIVWALGDWAARWAFGDPADDQLDVGWLAWRLHQYVIDANIPDTRTVVEFALTGIGGGQSWLVLDKGSSTACQIDPGYEADIVVHGDNRELHRWLLGTCTYKDLQRSAAIRITGPSRLARGFATWFDTALFREGLAARPHPKQGPVVQVG